MGIVAMILAVILPLLGFGKADSHAVTIVPPMPQRMPIVTDNDEFEWAMFNADAYIEHCEAFDALFNSYETKWARNGALMIRQGNSGSYRFAKKGSK